MSTATSRLRSAVTLDRQAGYLAVLFLLVEIASIWLARQAVAGGAEIEGPAGVGGTDASATEAAGAGAAWVGLEVGFAIALLGAILLYRRLPEQLQKAAKASGLALFFLALGGHWSQQGVLRVGAVLVVGTILVAYVTDWLDVWWAVNNVIAVLLAIAVGAALPLVFGVWGLLIALAGMTVYDHYFANKREYMFDLAGALLHARLPVIVFKPPTLRYDWDELMSEDVEQQDHAWGIGMADLALPAGFAAAVAVAETGALVRGGALAAAGVVVGTLVACFRLRYEMLTRGSGAGLPALTTGAVAGFLALQVPLAVVALA